MKTLLTAVALAATAATAAVAANWTNEVTITDRAHVIGKADAPVKLTEFISYTCPHCATFANEGEAPIHFFYIGAGKLKLEVRSIIRNDVDLAATLLVQCGDKARFPRNHTYFMTSQATWLPIARRATSAQLARWSAGDAASRRAMASDLGFYGMMEARGYTRPELDACLSDDARAAQLRANSDADFTDFGITGTPSFAIDGTTTTGVHDWTGLRPLLDTHF